MFHICIYLRNWGVEGAMCKFLEFLDQHPQRNNLSKLATFDPILQRPHSAVVGFYNMVTKLDWLKSVGELYKNTSKTCCNYERRSWCTRLEYCEVSSEKQNLAANTDDVTLDSLAICWYFTKYLQVILVSKKIFGGICMSSMHLDLKSWQIKPVKDFLDREEICFG